MSVRLVRGRSGLPLRVPRPLQPAQLAARAGLAVDPNGFQGRICRTAHLALCRAAAQHLGARDPHQRHGGSGAGEEAAGLCPGHCQQSSIPVHHALDRRRHPRLHAELRSPTRPHSAAYIARPARLLSSASQRVSTQRRGAERTWSCRQGSAARARRRRRGTEIRRYPRRAIANSTAPAASAAAPADNCCAVAPNRMPNETSDASTGITGPSGMTNSAGPISSVG